MPVFKSKETNRYTVIDNHTKKVRLHDKQTTISHSGNGFGRSFGMFNNPAFGSLAKIKFTTYETQIFFAFMALIKSPNQKVLIHATKLSEALGMTRPSFSSALRSLKTKGIILECGKQGTFKYYRFNPHVIWKGDTYEHKTDMKKIEKPKFMLINGDLSKTRAEEALSL